MKATNSKSQNRLSALLIALTLVAVVVVSAPIATAQEHAHPAVTLAKLAGSGQATLIGEGGCGFGTKLLNFNMNSAGESTSGTWASNTVSCGSGTTPLTVTVTSLSADGSGEALLVAGTATFHMNIQVNSNGTVFNLVDITDSSNYQEGVAIKQ